MAPSPSLKRKASTCPNKSNKHAKKYRRCIICHDVSLKGQFKQLDTCAKERCNRTCNFCWKKHLKVVAIDDPAADIKCFTCETPVATAGVIKSFDTDDPDLNHYLFRLKGLEAQKNGTRVCTRGECKSLQVQRDGRLFTCDECGAQDCSICDVPEHPGETCEERQWRQAIEHGDEESKTTIAFADGYDGRETTTGGNVKTKDKHPWNCPGCGIRIEREIKCPRVRCTACGMEFCTRSDCGAQYLGQGSVRTMGNAAHAMSCRHRSRAVEDRRFARPPSNRREISAEEIDKGDEDDEMAD